MSEHLNILEIENFKRIKAFKMECANSGLTIIGGRNRQGKTSVLDAIAFLLGGQRYAPTSIKREGSLANPEIRLTLSNGLIVERKGKNASLKIIDPQGRTGGQRLLDSFISQFALNLPKFLNSTSKEKAEALLQIIGVKEELAQLEKEENLAYNDRHALGRIADQKRKFADELVTYADAPDTPVSASELIQEQQGILARNGENLRKRQEVTRIESEESAVSSAVMELKKCLADEEEKLSSLTRDLETARKSVKEIWDESTAEIETRLRKIDDTNIKVRANLDKAKAIEDAEEQSKQYDALTEKLEGVRSKKAALLENADLPLPGLFVEQGELLYNGKAWDCMSGSEILQVATAIVRKLNPKCGFVLLDKLEQMDLETLKDFGEWLEAEGLQAIATRVSMGDECSIIIEDGVAQPCNSDTPTKTALSVKPW